MFSHHQDTPTTPPPLDSDHAFYKVENDVEDGDAGQPKEYAIWFVAIRKYPGGPWEPVGPSYSRPDHAWAAYRTATHNCPGAHAEVAILQVMKKVKVWKSGTERPQ